MAGKTIVGKCVAIGALLAVSANPALTAQATPPRPQDVAIRRPERILDTRTGTGAPAHQTTPGAPIRLVIPEALAAGASAVVLNLTAVNSTEDGYVKAWPCNEAEPASSAINYLAGEGPYADRAAHPIPRLVLLDIKMPHLGGLDVLRWIRSRDSFRDMPVLMLTSSSQASDVATACAVGADSYLVKPSNLDAFRELVEDLVAICSDGERRRGALNVRGAIRPPGK